MTRLHHLALGLVLVLAGCEHNEKTFPNFQFTGKVPMLDSLSESVGGRIDEAMQERPAKIRLPVLPEMLVGCRGHVLVPALGMRLVERGKEPPSQGQFIREERLTPPYRVIPYGARVSMEQSPQRLSVELDQRARIIGLYCG